MNQHPTFVHLTDLHVGNPAVRDDHLHSDTNANLAAMLREVKLIRPAPRFIVASGDLTNQGDVASFQELKRIFQEAGLQAPVIWALGNHDSRPGFYRGMLGRVDNLTAPYFHDQVIERIHIITLDSSDPCKVGGTIEPEQFAWLERTLDTHPELPKLIVCHHGPALDEDNFDMEFKTLSCADTIRLRKVLAGHHVIGLLSGHLHIDRVSNWNGIPVVVGIGPHCATDVLYLHESLRLVSATSFAIGTVRPSGLTVSFVPQPSEKRELHRTSLAGLGEAVKRHEAALAAKAAAAE
jgi:3',5'-cyclic AMP phosphodiesterase CpdA